MCGFRIFGCSDTSYQVSKIGTGTSLTCHAFLLPALNEWLNWWMNERLNKWLMISQPLHWESHEQVELWRIFKGFRDISLDCNSMFYFSHTDLCLGETGHPSLQGTEMLLLWVKLNLNLKRLPCTQKWRQGKMLHFSSCFKLKWKYCRVPWWEVHVLYSWTGMCEEIQPFQIF